MTKIYLVTHADSAHEAADSGSGLSFRGKLKRRELAFLAEKNVQAIYTSPLKQCQETIEPLAKKLTLQPVVIPNLRERLASPSKLEPFLPALKYLWALPTQHFPGGESNVVAQNRGIKVVEEIIERHSKENVILATHGNLLALIINYYDASVGFTFLEQLNFPSVVELSLEGDKVTYQVLV